MEVGTLWLGRREQALLDEIRMAAFVSDSELCLVAVRELLDLWLRTPDYPLPGKPVDRAALASRIREMAHRYAADQGPPGLAGELLPSSAEIARPARRPELSERLESWQLRALPPVTWARGRVLR